MDKFAHKSSFNPKANFTQVVFGADSMLLETELNELQEIVQDFSRRALKAVCGNNILRGNVTYDSLNSEASIANLVAIVDGYLVDIDSSIVSCKKGDYVYLSVKEVEVTGKSVIHPGGDTLTSKTIENNIIDSRYGVETSRRKQLQFTISVSPGEDSDASGLFLFKVSEDNKVNLQKVSTLDEISYKLAEFKYHEEDKKIHQKIEVVSAKEYEKVKDSLSEGTLYLVYEGGN